MLPLFRWIGCGNAFVSVVDADPHGTAVPRHRVKIYGRSPNGDGDSDMCMCQASASHPDASTSNVAWGSVDCGLWTMPIPTSSSSACCWCLVIVSTERWSFNGTLFPKYADQDVLRKNQPHRNSMDCVGMRTMLDALHGILARPIATLSVSEDAERNNIAHEYIVRTDALRWMHLLCLGNRAAGARWHQLVTTGEPIARAARMHTLHRTRSTKHRNARDDVALRQCDTTPQAYHNDTLLPHQRSTAVVAPTAAAWYATNVGSECIRYLGWVSLVVRNLLEECIIFLQAEGGQSIAWECASTEVVCTTPETQRQWLETCESTDRLATLEEAWASWMRQRSAIQAAYQSVAHRWEQFQFTVDTYGFQRLSLFEQARIGGGVIWAMASIERAQLITLHSVAHLTPQLGSEDQIRFCRSLVRVLLDVCSGP